MQAVEHEVQCELELVIVVARPKGTSMGDRDRHLRHVRISVNRENPGALASLLESGAVQVIIDKTYPFDHTATAVAHMLGHHARGKVAITIP